MTLGNGGTALLNSSHAAQLEESLRETRRVLDHSQNARQVTERAKRQLEAQLSDSQRRHGEVAGAKATLENSKIDLELEVRCLLYRLKSARDFEPVMVEKARARACGGARTHLTYF